jgi:quercetin dioxygenase-like cupin family protein
MKRSLILIPALFATAALAQLPFLQQERAGGDAVSVDPTHHKVILDNDHVRVFEVVAAPGAESPMHQHPPTVLVSLDRARFHQTLPDGTQEVFDFHPGQVIWLDQFQHSWQMLSGEGRLIGVEVKAATQAGARSGQIARPDSDAVAVDPQHHHVVEENPHIRVFQALAEPGANSPMHTHPPYLLISHDKVRMRMQTAEGEEIADLNPGEVLWFDGVEHAWEIVSGTLNATAIEVNAALGEAVAQATNWSILEAFEVGAPP